MLERLPAGYRSLPLLEVAFQVIWMNRKLPTEPNGAFQRKAGIFRPAAVYKCGGAVGRGRPCHFRNGFDQFAQLSLAPPQPVILAFYFCSCGLRLSEVEVVIDRECDDTSNQSQKADVVAAVSGSRSPGHAQSAQAPVRRRERNEDQGTDFDSLGSEPFLEALGDSFIRIPVRNVKRFLRRVRPPRWPLFDRNT